MKCTRVLRRVTSGTFRYKAASSRARLSAFPLTYQLLVKFIFLNYLRADRLVDRL
jgi:hypothetical protein